MIRTLSAQAMGRSDQGWLSSLFHFSFADYYDPDNKNFGVLRVLNDDLILPGTGFEWHAHRDMEILSYVLKGEITHSDSLGHENTIGRGDMQYMSAGTGVTHKEYNLSGETARLLQIWIFPDARGHQPRYGGCRFARGQRLNTWLRLASSMESEAPIRIHQDVNVYAAELEKGRSLDLRIAPGRQAYLVQIEGEALAAGERLKEGDAMEIAQEDISLRAESDSHFLLIEMKKPG